jgi:thymidylate synthase
MKSFEYQYKALIRESLASGILRPTRSGINALSLIGKTLEHDMSTGFPLLTLRKMPERSMRVETEFYLKGYTDRSWLTDRGCNFWNYWDSKNHSNPNDLGPTYGFEWRHWNAEYEGVDDYSGKGIDQISWILGELKSNPESKRLIVSQWNASDISKQMIPPCPFAFQLIKYGDKLNLIFYQRSGDLCLGIPNDFAQHALILHLICMESGYLPGKVVGMFGQTELYENHIEGAKVLLARRCRPLPTAQTEKFSTLFDWSFSDTKFINYKPQERISFPIAI